jgi:hypothetical protein
MPKQTMLAIAAAGSAVVGAYFLYRMYRRRPTRSWPHGVEVRQSRIKGAGDGLFAWRDFAAGEELGVYYGRVLSLLQAPQLVDRDYLMGGFGCAPQICPSRCCKCFRMHIIFLVSHCALCVLCVCCVVVCVCVCLAASTRT